MRIRLLLLSLVICVILVGACIVPTLPPTTLGEGIEPIPEAALKSKFGVFRSGFDPARLDKDRKVWVTEGLLWERDHPGKANWQVIEPSRGNYNWTIIDNYVRSAQASGVQILFTIWPFTDWDQLICNSDLPEEPPLPIGAAEKGKDPGGFSELSRRRGKPCDMNVYQDYLRFLVERYDGDGDNDMAGLRYPVKYWEVGNEPELDFFFQGTPQDYFELLKITYETIKSIDPSARVLHGAAIEQRGIDPDLEFRPFWEEFFELGAADYFDIANIHSPPDVQKFANFLKEQGGGGKPIWVTEMGSVNEWLPEYGMKEGDLESVTEALVRVFTEAFENGAERIFISGWGTEEHIAALHEVIRIIEDR